MKKYVVQIISLCGLISCSLGICFNSQGVFFEAASRDLNVMVGTFSMQNTISYIITSFGAVYVARIIPKVNYRCLLFCGALMTGASFIIMGFTSSLIVFYILGIIRGIGAAAFAVAVVTIGINNWFKEKTGFITSIVFSTSGIVGMLLPPLFSYIIDSYSWRVAYMIMGGISFTLILPALVSGFTIHPEISGRKAYGESQAKMEAAAGEEAGSCIVFGALVGIAVIYNIILGFAQHLPVFCVSRGFGSQAGAVMLSMCMLGNVAFKLLSGNVSDKAGPVKTILLMVGVNVCALAAMFSATGILVLNIASFLFGVMYAVATVCLSLLTAAFFTGEMYNKKFPAISFAGGLAQSIAVSVLGYIYDYSGSYNVVLILLLILHLSGFILLSMFAGRKKI